MTATYTEKGKTTIQITTETRDRLVGLGGKGDSYEDVIKRLLDEKYTIRLNLTDKEDMAKTGEVIEAALNQGLIASSPLTNPHSR